MSAASWLAGSQASSSTSTGTRRLEEAYELDKSAQPLGKGAFGMVFLAKVRTDPCTKVAIKMMDKARLRQLKAPTDMVSNEVELMRECSSRDNFVHLLDFVETP